MPSPPRRARPLFAHLFGLAALAAVAPLPPTEAASGECRVASGYDVFTTDASGTTLGIQALAGLVDPLFHYQGVPDGQFAFGSAGVRPTGPADTVVARLAEGSPTSPVVPVQLVGLQLASVETVGGQQHFITLQTART